MTFPNMAAITESFKDCSLNPHENGGVVTSGKSLRSRSPSSSSSSSAAAPEDEHPGKSETTLELNSQCPNLKTGEIYHINWKAKEDARTNMNTIMRKYKNNGDLHREEEEEEEETSYVSEESSSESSPSPPSSSREQYGGDHVLVVAGCKSCLMYIMVPKHAEDCPKCNCQLLHFDRSENSSP